MKIKTTNVALLSRKVHLPGNKELTDIPEDGVIEVSEELADMLINKTSDWIDPAKVVKKEKAQAKTSPREKETLKSILNSLELEDLIQLGTQSGISKRDLEKMKTVPIMSSFLASRLDQKTVASLISE